MANRSPTPSVETSWARIESWLKDHVPGLHRALQLPATIDEIQQAEQALGLKLPHDLKVWWQACGGFSEQITLHPGHLLPRFYDPYSPQRALKRRETSIQVRSQLASTFPEGFDQHVAEQEQNTAGSPCNETWLDHWLPIAGGSGSNSLFVDLRAGSKRGCIMEYDRVYGAPHPPIWPNVAVMLHRLADALQQGTPVQDSTPVVIDGRLRWQPA